MYVNLSKTSRVKRFVEKTLSKECNCYLISGRYVVNAKSLLGIFSLDLTKAIFLEVEDGDYSEFAEFNAVVTEE